MLFCEMSFFRREDKDAEKAVLLGIDSGRRSFIDR